MTKALRMTPSTLGKDRRHFPWRDGSRVAKVPLWPANPEGQWFEGRIDVPTRLSRTAPHTNTRLEFDNLLAENLKRWTDWRQMRGWVLNSVPRLRGPYDVPTEKTGDECDPEFKHYFALARFVRTTPMYIGLDDMLHELERGQRYGVDITADTLPWNDAEGGEDSGWVDPMKHAAARREALGINRADYLYGPLNDPQSKPKGVNPL